MFFFKKKTNKKSVTSTKSGVKLLSELDLKPYSQLKFDLIYAQNEILVDNDDVIIAVRKYRGTLLKFMLVHKFEKMDSYSLDNESLQEYASKIANLVNIERDDLYIDREVRTIIYNESSDEIKEHCFLNSKATRKYYEQHLVFNHKSNKLESYRKLKDFDTLHVEAMTSLYFDLACVDKEEA